MDSATFYISRVSIIIYEGLPVLALQDISVRINTTVPDERLTIYGFSRADGKNMYSVDTNKVPVNTWCKLVGAKIYLLNQLGITDISVSITKVAFSSLEITKKEIDVLPSKIVIQLKKHLNPQPRYLGKYIPVGDSLLGKPMGYESIAFPEFIVHIPVKYTLGVNGDIAYINTLYIPLNSIKLGKRIEVCLNTMKEDNKILGYSSMKPTCIVVTLNHTIPIDIVIERLKGIGVVIGLPKLKGKHKNIRKTIHKGYSIEALKDDIAWDVVQLCKTRGYSYSSIPSNFGGIDSSFNVIYAAEKVIRGCECSNYISFVSGKKVGISVNNKIIEHNNFLPSLLHSYLMYTYSVKRGVLYNGVDLLFDAKDITKKDTKILQSIVKDIKGGN